MKSISYITMLATAAILSGSLAGPVLAQQGSLSETETEFVALSAAEDTDAEDWFALAGRAREAGDLDTARQALSLASSDGIPPARIALERARLQVAAGEADTAVATLRALYDGGFTNVAAIRSDPVLTALAGRSDYEALTAEMARTAYPCEHVEGFGDFDFWVGDWVVHTADGRPAGENRIEKQERGCVLVERWSGAGGGTGMSINYLDRRSNEWVQVWNSASGGQIHIRGGLTDEGMRLVGEIHYVASGTTADFRGLWTPLPDGRVRQFFEQSDDGGETWSAWFEGFYSRRPPADGGGE